LGLGRRGYVLRVEISLVLHSRYIINQGSPYPLVTLNPFSQELLLSDVFTGIKWSTLIKRTLGHEQLRRCFPFFSRLFATGEVYYPFSLGPSARALTIEHASLSKIPHSQSSVFNSLVTNGALLYHTRVQPTNVTVEICQEIKLTTCPFITPLVCTQHEPVAELIF
jgi:hypothetical protein